MHWKSLVIQLFAISIIMLRHPFIAVGLIFFLAFPPLATSAEVASAVDANSSTDASRARILLKRAVKLYKEKGEQALAAFNQNDSYKDGELYVYVLGSDGQFKASGGPSSALIGQNVSDLKDASGEPFFRQILDTSGKKGHGEVAYHWLNRLDNRVEQKVAYFELVGNNILCVGYYIPRATAAQAKTMLNQAVSAVESNREAAYAEINQLTSRFHQDDLYVFVVDLNDGRMLAHGVNARLIGKASSEILNADGKPVVTQMINILRDKSEGELDYRWRNPLTKRIENKHTLFKKVGNEMVAVGYFVR